MKLLTYAALGKAIVACAGSAKGLVDGVDARVVVGDDPASFAGAVVELLRDRPLRVRLGQAARRTVEDGAAWNAGLERIESIYHRVLAARPPVLLPVTATE
jgi:glycosyltransferase involved in cell wall biosynthesis